MSETDSPARPRASFATVWVASMLTIVVTLALVALAVRAFGGDDTDLGCVAKHRASADRAEATLNANSTPEEMRSVADTMEGHAILMSYC